MQHRVQLSRDWLPAPRSPSVEEAEVHVWRVAVDEVSTVQGGPGSFLSPDERQRAARFRFEPDRRRWVVARGWLRQILARYLHSDPEAVQLAAGPHGKPFVASDHWHRGLEFNLSHSGDYVLYAVGRAPVGVDVELIRPDRDIQGLARRWFSAREYRQLTELSPADAVDAFYAAWTRKEAYLKARGQGISAGLDRVEVTIDPLQVPRVIADARDAAAPSRWILHDVDVATGYRASVVVASGTSRVQLFVGR